MRFYNMLFYKLRIAGVFLICILLTDTISAQVQKEKKVKQVVDVTLKVVDENGIAVPNAQVVIGEGVIHQVTDENGFLSFKGYLNDFVTISSSAYEKNVSLVNDLLKNNTVKLLKSKLYMTSSDDIPLPFTTIKRRNMTSATTVIDGKRLEMYPSTDLRNALTGLATGVEISEINSQPGISTVDVTTRGQSMMYIIDNIRSDISEIPLDPNEIESVSLIKDIVGKAMFGPEGAGGIVYITTRRGSKNEHGINVNFEHGVSSVDRFPEWVSGAEYATLNNQARLNSGLIPNYSAADDSAYALNNPYDKFHPSINFRDMMLKNNRSFTKANLSSSGGNEIVQYYSYLGYNREGDIYKIGEKDDYNRITFRSNIDIKVNDLLKIQFNFYGNVSLRNSPNYEYTSILSDITSIPPTAFPVYASCDSISQVPWYGVSQAYPNNPIGNLSGRGYYAETGRTGAANIALNYDMGHLIQGLKSKTFLGFNIFNDTRIGKAEDYIAYIATPGTTSLGADTILLSLKHLGVDKTDEALLGDSYFQRFAVYENLNYERSFGGSDVRSSLTYYISKNFRSGSEEPQRQQNGILTGSYTYNDKYSFQGVLNYAGTYSFDKGKRYALFPSAGVSWVISEENFMSGLKFINFLKLRGEAGILGNEIYLPPYYSADSWNIRGSGFAFGPQPTNTWFGTNLDQNVVMSNIQRLGNPDLTWEKAKELSLGFDALLLKGKLSLEMTWYNNVRDGQIVQVYNYLPLMLGLANASPYYNYNKTRYFGLETGLQFADRNGDFFYSIGGSATIQNSERLKYDEPNFRFAYQSRAGKPVDAYFGQTYLGKFTTDAEALVIPQKFDAVLHAGDLKYADMNNDGIVDDNDQSMTGHTTPHLFYALNARVGLKGFELTVVGTGRAFYDIPLTNSYFQNGWGDNTYSAFVRDNIDGAYPNLTYYKVNNNFVSSNFWLTKGGFFKIQNVELAYNLPVRISQIIGGRLIRIYMRGANLLTISKIKDVDPESVNSGVTGYPLFRTITCGFKFNF